MTDVTPPLGVSVVVRIRRDVGSHRSGAVGMIVDQFPDGRHRYKVLIPGDPYPIHLRGEDLEALQGIDPERWWRKR